MLGEPLVMSILRTDSMVERSPRNMAGRANEPRLDNKPKTLKLVVVIAPLTKSLTFRCENHRSFGCDP
jgi:hypothetical protein